MKHSNIPAHKTRRKSCRSMLQYQYLVDKIDIDTTANKPWQVCRVLASPNLGSFLFQLCLHLGSQRSKPESPPAEASPKISAIFRIFFPFTCLCLRKQGATKTRRWQNRKETNSRTLSFARILLLWGRPAADAAESIPSRAGRYRFASTNVRRRTQDSSMRIF